MISTKANAPSLARIPAQLWDVRGLLARHAPRRPFFLYVSNAQNGTASHAAVLHHAAHAWAFGEAAAAEADWLQYHVQARRGRNGSAPRTDYSNRFFSPV